MDQKEWIFGNIKRGKKIREHAKSKEDLGAYKKEIRLKNIKKGKKIGEHTKMKEDWET